MEKSETLNQLLELLSESELREYVLEYAEGNKVFKAFLLSHIRTDYVENETKDVDYKSEIEWIFSQTTDIGDRWHSYETADWCEIFECMDRVFHDADILLEQGNAEVPLAIAVQFFVSLDETCREHPEYDEEYDAEDAIEKAEHLILECIDHPSVSEDACQEAFSVVKRLAVHNSIESYRLSMDSLLMEMSVKTASDEEALKLLDEMIAQKGVNHRYVTWKVELLRKLGRSEEAEKTLRQHLYMPEQVRHSRPRRSPFWRSNSRLWYRPPQKLSRLSPIRRHPLHLLRALHHRRSPPSRRQELWWTDRRGQVNDKKCDFCGYLRKNAYLYRGIM